MNLPHTKQNYWTKQDALIVLCYNTIMLVPWIGSLVLGISSRETVVKIAENGSLLPISFWVFSLFPIVIASWLVYNRKKQEGCTIKELLGVPSLNGLCGVVQTGFLGGIVLFFFAFLILQYWGPFLSRYGIEAPSQYLIEVLNSGLISNWQILGIGILVVIFAPIAEEIFYRGIIYEQIKRNTNKLVAILLSSAFFALVHTNLFALPSVFFVGVGFSLIYDKN